MAQDEALSVTQADREAAAAYARMVATSPLEGYAITWIEAGKSDDSPIVQAFARHRLSHSTPGDAEVRKALEEIADAHLGDQPAASGGSEYDWACRHIARIRATAHKALATPSGRAQGEWRPFIGQEVRAASHIIEKWPDWRDTRLWVVGIAKDRIGNQYPVDGINITVSDEWPVNSKTGGFTDGFYIGRQYDADDLEPAASPAQDQGEGEPKSSFPPVPSGKPPHGVYG